MRLFLAAAVLLLALATNAEAQETSFGERFALFRDQLASMGTSLLEQSKAVVEDIRNSEYAAKSKNWLEKRYEEIKNRVHEISS